MELSLGFLSATGWTPLAIAGVVVGAAGCECSLAGMLVHNVELLEIGAGLLFVALVLVALL